MAEKSLPPTGGPIYNDGNATSVCVICRKFIEHGEEYFVEIEGNYHVRCADQPIALDDCAYCGVEKGERHRKTIVKYIVGEE